MRRISSLVSLRLAAGAAAGALAMAPAPAAGQDQSRIVVPAASAPAAKPADPQVVVPADYVIGPEDVLTVHFRFDPDLSGDVTVRPEGKISLPIVGDVVAVGLTVEQLRAKLTAEASKYIKVDPAITVQAKAIRSRKVYIQGMVAKQGAYDILGPMDVLTLLSLAGGVLDFADEERILIIRVENGVQTSRTFNYSQVKRGRNLDQNIQLKPGDKVIVPD